MKMNTSAQELSVRAVLLGLLLAVIMGAANVYLGLKAGMTVSASIPAAVLAAVVLRGFFKNGTILEANQVQTAASAGESLAAGIIFTMPAMTLTGAWKEFNFVITTLIAFTGGLLGILFMIPVAVGIYLPFLLAVPMIAGGVIVWMNRSRTGSGSADRKVLFASGAIAGESLTGVGIALCAALGVSRIECGIRGDVRTVLAVIAALGLVAVFYYFSRSRKN